MNSRMVGRQRRRVLALPAAAVAQVGGSQAGRGRVWKLQTPLPMGFNLMQSDAMGPAGRRQVSRSFGAAELLCFFATSSSAL